MDEFLNLNTEPQDIKVRKGANAEKVNDRAKEPRKPNGDSREKAPKPFKVCRCWALPYTLEEVSSYSESQL